MALNKEHVRFHINVFNVLTFVCFLGVNSVLKLFFIDLGLTQGEDSGVSTIINLAVYVVAFIYTINNGKRSYFKGAITNYAVILFFYVLISLVWVNSSNSSFSINNFIHLLGSIFLALALFISFCRAGFVLNDKMLMGIKTALIATLAYMLIFPQLSTSTLEGRFNSILPTPNNLGQFTALSLLFILTIARRSVFKIIFIIICLVLLGASQSYSSVIGVIFCYLLYRSGFKVGRYRKVLMLPFIIFCFLVFFFASGLFSFSGVSQSNKIGSRDLTFTGRTVIWELLLKDVSKKIITGYGFSGYWGIDKAPSSGLQDEFGMIYEGHNGYFDLFIDLGVIGYILFALTVAYLIKSYKFHNNSVQFLMILLIFILLNNFTESSFLKSKHPLNIQFLFILFTVNYYNYEKKRLYISKRFNRAATVQKPLHIQS